jgi:hypothetical protein
MADQYGNKGPLCDYMLAVGEDASDEVLTKTFAEFSNLYWGKDFCAGGFCTYRLFFELIKCSNNFYNQIILSKLPTLLVGKRIRARGGGKHAMRLRGLTLLRDLEAYAQAS